MIKVIAYGDRILVPNPAKPGQQTEMVNVTFSEEGRPGANQSLSESSDFLSRIAGVQTGLDQLRVHTQPIQVNAVAKFPLGFEIPSLFINRKLFSTPQMRKQENVAPRTIEGRPTYFTTEISDAKKEDVDLRLSNEAIINAQGSILFAARVGATEVRVVRAAEPANMEAVISAGTA